MSASDCELLRQYAAGGSDQAFAVLVERHLDLVYSAARRQVRSAALAEEVAQSVFIDLARRAPSIPSGTPLVAWLHVVSRRTAIDVIRRESRRQSREQQAAELGETMKSNSPEWAGIEPLLDEAVESLDPADRAAILLRYFEKKSLRDVGAALGTSEDTAQKRVSRAVEQLRAFFVRRGVTVTAAGLVTDLSAHALQTAPAGLGAVISSVAAASGVTTSAVIAMTTLQKSVSLAAFIAVGGAGLYQATLVARQSDEIAALLARNHRTASEVHALDIERAAVSAKLKDVERRIDVRLAAATPRAAEDAALESQMQAWFDQLDRINEFLAQHPDWNIPELKLLPADHWFNAAATDRFESPEQFRQATARLRDAAVGRASQKIMVALSAYVRSHDGLLPTSAPELAPYFNPSIDSAILARYEMLRTGKASEVPRNQATRILAPRPADVEYDAYAYIGLNGYGNGGVAMGENVREARRQFAEANGGQNAPTAEQLLPYLKWPVALAALQKYLGSQ